MGRPLSHVIQSDIAADIKKRGVLLHKKGNDFRKQSHVHYWVINIHFEPEDGDESVSEGVVARKHFE